MSTSVRAAAAGIVAAGAGVAAGELVAAVLSPSLSPVTAVGGAVIDFVPPGVKEWAISLFGTADKAALIAGMALVIALLAAAAGVIEFRRPGFGVGLVGAAGALGLAAVLTRTQATMLAAAAPIAAVAVAMPVLRTLVRRLAVWQEAEYPAPAPGSRTGPQTGSRIPSQTPSQAPSQSGPINGQAAQHDAPPGEAGAQNVTTAPMARRRFAKALGLAAVLAAAGGGIAAVVRRGATVADDFRNKLSLPAPAMPAPPIPAGAELAFDGMPPLVTPNRDFYRIDTALAVPAVNADTWKLKVTGMVEQEVELDFATLLGKPLTERHITIACVSNEVGGSLIGNARWLGWPVRELLQMAGPKPGADMVFSTSTDGWTASTPLEALTDSRDALLAIGMNGEPLPLEHGFPVRLIVPGLYGFVSATKWLTTLKVTRFADDVAYWTPRGWSDHGPIKTQSRIDVPRAGRTVPAGNIRFGGIAWAQHTGITKVELRINRGQWREAVLAPGISNDTWYQWQLGAELTPGAYEIQVRATDATGTPQTEESKPVAPNGATGYHTLNLKVT